MSGDNEMVGAPPDDGTEQFPIPEEYAKLCRNPIDISPAKNGKLWKEVLQESTSEETPMDGEEVSVNYIGKLLDGTEFDRSRDKPFEFILGKSQVIKGWDIAVATMKKNEKILVSIHPSLAYGSQKIGNIPTNSTLVFEIELLSWKSEDLSDKKDGGIIRKKIKRGSTHFLHPKEGSEVEVEIEKLLNGEAYETQNIKFTIGEGSEIGIPRGIEKALLSFNHNEKSKLTLAPMYAYGPDGKPEENIPSNTPVEFIVTLHGFTKLKEVWECNGQEKLVFSRMFKEKGTKYYKENKIVLALKQYKKIPEYLKAEAMLTGEEEEERKSLLKSGNLNLSICYIKNGEFPQALTAAEEALLFDANNEKAWFRKGLAYFGINEPEKAKEDFQKVLSIDPKNQAAVQQIQNCNNKIKENLEKDKKLFAKMF